jgi:hypothetical protein
MSLASIVSARVHPAIGIARVGNATGPDDYFLGPEVPYPVAPPNGGYRDAKGRLKRQGAKFRIYGYDSEDNVVDELTDDKAEIEWHVHVANKKAAWYNFDAALDIPETKGTKVPRRNAHIRGEARKNLIIDPGCRSVNAKQCHARFDTGNFLNIAVDLGEIRYLKGGRLLFLGGHGKSAPVSPEFALSTFANNSGWYDDTSDGPVSATVTIDGRSIPVDPGWVITAPPNYAPDLVASQTMYEVILDCLKFFVPRDPPSFTKHILPIFQQFTDGQWANAGFAAQFGWKGIADFTRGDFLQKLATRPRTNNGIVVDPYQELRRRIFVSFRDPASTTFDASRWPLIYGDAMFVQTGPSGPRGGLALNKLSYSYLQRWMQGDFDSDYRPGEPRPASIEGVPKTQQPDRLDEAALHFCIGGPFHPGCEMTWTMRNASMYRGKFRLRRRAEDTPEKDYGDFLTQEEAVSADGPICSSGPGDITRWMAVPWQADTASCRQGYNSDFPPDELIPGYWPSRVPNHVLSEASYRIVVAGTTPNERLEAFQKRDQFLRFLGTDKPYLVQVSKMVDHFHELGILERREADLGRQFPEVIYVETLPAYLVDPAAGQTGSFDPDLSGGFQEARFHQLLR